MVHEGDYTEKISWLSEDDYTAITTQPTPQSFVRMTKQQ